MLQKEFGFRAGNQDCRADNKLQRPELAAADNILEGFTLAAPPKKRLETAPFFLLNRLIMQEKEFAAGDVETVTQEQFRLQRAVFNPGLGKGYCCRGKQLMNPYSVFPHVARSSPVRVPARPATQSAQLGDEFLLTSSGRHRH